MNLKFIETKSIARACLALLGAVLFASAAARGQDAPKPVLVDSFNYNNSEEGSARIDYWRNELMKSPANAGLIVVYGGQTGIRGEVAAHVRGIRKAFYTKGIDLERSPVIDGGFRERLTVEFWVIPPGAETPRPTPTVDKKSVRFKGTLRRNAAVPYECCG